MTREEAAQKLEASGIAKHEDLAKMLAPSVRIRTQPCGDEAPEIGTSRFGGAPDAPADFAWPRFNDKPLGFLGLINLRDLDGFQTELTLPDDGVLLFFFESDQCPWGFDPNDAEGSRVVYVPHGVPLTRIASPSDLDAANVFRACALRFEPAWELPDFEGHAKGFPFDLDDPEISEAFEDLYDEFAADGPEHHLGGHPQPVQGEMRLECQLASHGLYCGDASGYENPRRAELEPGAADWTLLLQIDTDEDGPQWMWGDCGMLYFWIRRQDAASGAFDKAWMVLQCG